MSGSKSRRHYRVAQREAEQSPSKGTFVPNEKRNTLLAIGLVVLFMTYVSGVMFGYFISSKCNKY